MNKKIENESYAYLNQRIFITLIFFILVMGHVSIITRYIITLFDSKAKIEAKALVWSQELKFIDALDPANGEAKIDQIRGILIKTLLLNDINTGNYFISGVKLEVDYDLVKAREGTLDLEMGDIGGKDSIITKIPIYSRTTRELLGLATFYYKKGYIQYLEEVVKSNLAVGVFILFLLLIMIWFILKYLYLKIIKTERELQEKQSRLAIADKLRPMGVMAVEVAHKINNPLQSILYTLDKLDDTFKKAKASRDASKISQSIKEDIKRAVDAVDEMCYSIRKKPNETELIYLHEPLERALSCFKEQFKVHNISLKVNIDKNLPKVKIDPRDFEKIAENLLSNACDAVNMKARELGKDYQKNYKKEVEVRLYNKRRDIVFEIQDNGIGMDPEIKDRCLEPYYTTKEGKKGTGLGLFIVYSIIMMFGMHYSITSIKDKGSLFQILIPIKKTVEKLYFTKH